MQSGVRSTVASSAMAAQPDEFAMQWARTRRFSLGLPRRFTVTRERVLFLRTRSGRDPTSLLWRLEIPTGKEHLVADPDELAGEDTGAIPPEERIRRERSRERAGGIVAYSADQAARTAVFSWAGALWVADTTGASGPPRKVLDAPVVNPVIDPTGAYVAYVSDRALHLVHADGSGGRTLAAPEGESVSYGLAEYVAAEEMGRSEGFWWSPSGDRLLVARVDASSVARWFVSDPSDPRRPPTELHFPPAGGANADVRLSVYGLDGSEVPVNWDRERFEYVASVNWGPALLIAVQSRDQRLMHVLEVEPTTGKTEVRGEQRDPSWVDIVPGTPALTPSGELVSVVRNGDTRSLKVGEQLMTPPGLHVRSVISVEANEVIFTGSTDPTELHLWSCRKDELQQLTADAGVHAAFAGGDALVVVSERLDGDTRVSLRTQGKKTEIVSYVESPIVQPRVQIERSGPREIRTSLLLPSWYEPGSAKLPVLVDSYAGPGHARVAHARNRYLDSQWFAEQGFAVVQADGRGTPGRGFDWERAILRDLAGPVLEDQVAALEATAKKHPDLDLSRVGIRGWSFGGYLAALAVLRRPDTFHAAAAGAPVTDWRMYDTHYTERYLGHPDNEAEAYKRSSLLGEAGQLSRPLLLIHGLVDDNVLVAHSLRLSAELVSSSRLHAVLPLSAASHMGSKEDAAANILVVERDFFAESLRVTGPQPSRRR